MPRKSVQIKKYMSPISNINLLLNYSDEYFFKGTINIDCINSSLLFNIIKK